jgi:isochorismate hydrolase
MAKNSTNPCKTYKNRAFSQEVKMAQRVIPLSREKSILLLCDMQEKFRPTIKYFPQIIETSNKLLQACKILDVPYVITEQYPKGNSFTN